MTKKCADWCGGGCTQEQYDEAVHKGNRMAQELGEGWTLDVWENRGWHYATVSPSQTIRVYPSGLSYIAFINAFQQAGGQSKLVGHGDTPRQAVEDTVRLTRKEIGKLESWLEGVN